MQFSRLPIVGLTDEQVQEARKKYGANAFAFKKENRLLHLLKSIAGEPMVILLLLAAILYYLSGQTGEALFMAGAIFAVAGISIYQDTRSRIALDKLKQFTRPTCTACRNGQWVSVPTHTLVPGDGIVIEEGGQVPADGLILHSHDFSVNESILTGESMPLAKDRNSEAPLVFAGTTVVSGLAVVQVTNTGNRTKLGQIGLSLESISEEKTPLELQIGRFVQQMVFLGAGVFTVVWAINYYNTRALLDSLLKALTLAMSILPEEIPVAFTTFMAIGAWRLMKLGIVVKQMKTVETLGSASVICADKTGTITQNRMALAWLYTPSLSGWIPAGNAYGPDENNLVQTAMWASEPVPFDPMEQALHHHYAEVHPNDERSQFRMVHEYPLGGVPPMMTHVFENSDGRRIIAAKGAPEAIMRACGLSPDRTSVIQKAVFEMAAEGYRVLGVATADFSGNHFPAAQQDLPFRFMGLVAFHDPPKENMTEVLNTFNGAGIAVKMITGDNEATAAAIAAQVGLKTNGAPIDGATVMQMDDATLQKAVLQTNLFTRMYPEAKLRVINALKATGQIVAMTGDGVNDGPALKAAHIGIAMGKKGTEIARQAAALVLVEDDLARMADAVAMGRRIYTNLKKAIQYIISIHIPIILTVFIPLAAGWVYPNIFTPVHIIFMELIMGPTCSMVYENEPMEKNTMLQPPRPFTTSFFNWRELWRSILQGLMITAGALWMYRFAADMGATEAYTRTLTFITLISANIFLTLTNRSFYYSMLTSLGYKNRLMVGVILLTLLLVASMLYLPTVSAFFGLVIPSFRHLLTAFAAGFVSVIWFEGYKWWRRLSEKSSA